jgi:hypothetical protein
VLQQRFLLAVPHGAQIKNCKPRVNATLRQYA